MKRGLYSLILMFALCLSASNAATAGKFSDALAEQAASEFRGHPLPPGFVPVPLMEKRKAELTTVNAKRAEGLNLFRKVLTAGRILHATRDTGRNFFTVVYKGDIYNCITFKSNGNCQKVTDYLSR